MENFKDDIDKYANINCKRLSRVHLKGMYHNIRLKIQRIQLSSGKKGHTNIRFKFDFFFTGVQTLIHPPTQSQKALYNLSPFSLQLTF